MKKLFGTLLVCMPLWSEISVLELKNTLNECPNERVMLSPLSGAIMWQSGWLKNVFLYGPESACKKCITALFTFNDETGNLIVTRNTSSAAQLLCVYNLAGLLVKWYLQNKESVLVQNHSTLDGSPKPDQIKESINALRREIKNICLQDIARWHAVLQKAEFTDSTPSPDNYASIKSINTITNKELPKLLSLLCDAIIELNSEQAPFPSFTIEQILAAFWFATQQDTLHVAQYMDNILRFDLTDFNPFTQASYTLTELQTLPTKDEQEKTAVWLIHHKKNSTTLPPIVYPQIHHYGAVKSSVDMAETTVHNIINFLTYCPKSTSFSLKNFPTAHQKLVTFYQDYDVTRAQSDAARKAWFELICSLKHDDPSIVYLHDSCTTAGDELNILKILNVLLKTNLRNMLELERLSKPSHPIRVKKESTNNYAILSAGNGAELTCDQTLSCVRFGTPVRPLFTHATQDMEDPFTQALFLLSPSLAPIDDTRLDYYLFAHNIADVTECSLLACDLLANSKHRINSASPRFKIFEKFVKKMIAPRSPEWLKQIAQRVYTSTRIKNTSDLENLFTQLGISIEKTTLLSEMMARKDLDGMKRLIDADTDINKPDFSGKLPLERAIEEGNTSLVTLLIKNGAKINITYHDNDKSAQTPLLHAIKNGQNNIIQLLLQNGADPDYGPTGVMPLIAAIEGENTPLTVTLLESAAQANTVDADGTPALIVAIKKGLTGTINPLIKHGADINTTQNFGRSALTTAVECANKEITHTLLKHGANPDLLDGIDQTPLVLACTLGLTDIVALLLEHDAHPNIASGHKTTPLIAATQANNGTLIRLLLQKGAHVRHRDEFGKAAIDYAQTDEIKNLLTK